MEVVAPGDSGPGILTCSNLNAGISASGILRMESRHDPGSGYDQLTSGHGQSGRRGVAACARIHRPDGAQFDLISNDGNDARNRHLQWLRMARIVIAGAVSQL